MTLRSCPEREGGNTWNCIFSYKRGLLPTRNSGLEAVKLAKVRGGGRHFYSEPLMSKHISVRHPVDVLDEI